MGRRFESCRGDEAVIFDKGSLFFIPGIHLDRIAGRMRSLSRRNEVEEGNPAGETIKKPTFHGELLYFWLWLSDRFGHLVVV